MLLCEISIRRKKGDKKRRDEMCLTGGSSVVCKISSLRITKHFTSLAFLLSVAIKVSFLSPAMIIFWGARKHYINYPIWPERSALVNPSKMIFINHGEASDRFASPLSVFNRCFGQQQKQNPKKKLSTGTRDEFITALFMAANNSLFSCFTCTHNRD